jgi:hypothetical protein
MFLGSMGLLASCAMKPVAVDKASMAGVKRVGLPNPGFPNSPEVAVLNGIGQQFGLIGLVSTAIVRGNRSDAVVALMASKGFDPHYYFRDKLTARLQALNIEAVPEPAAVGRSSFLKDYAFASTDDAVLDVFVSRYGFFAFSDRDDTPYRPGVSLSMRLVSARDRSVLMQDTVLNTGIDAPVGKGTGSVPPSFTSFSDVTGNPDLAVTSLQLALAYAADTIGSRMA